MEKNDIWLSHYCEEMAAMLRAFAAGQGNFVESIGSPISRELLDTILTTISGLEKIQEEI